MQKFSQNLFSRYWPQSAKLKPQNLLKLAQLPKLVLLISFFFFFFFFLIVFWVLMLRSRSCIECLSVAAIATHQNLFRGIFCPLTFLPLRYVFEHLCTKGVQVKTNNLLNNFESEIKESTKQFRVNSKFEVLYKKVCIPGHCFVQEKENIRIKFQKHIFKLGHHIDVNWFVKVNSSCVMKKNVLVTMEILSKLWITDIYNVYYSLFY